MVAPLSSAVEVQEPVTRTRTVAGEEIWRGGSVSLDHDLVVASGGHLILDDVTLHISRGAQISVLPGGNLTVLDSNLDVEPGDEPGWSLQVLGALFAEESRLAHASSIEVRGLAHVTDSRIEGNVDHGIHTTRKGVSTLVDNLFIRNALEPEAPTAGAIVTTDATVAARDNVLVANGGFGFRTVSTLAGARLFGPAVATIDHNIVAHHAGNWAMHFQEYYNTIHQVEDNLLYGNLVGVNVQSTNDQMATRALDAPGTDSMFSGNAIVNNTVAAVNHGFVGSRDTLDDTLDPTADLQDSWIPQTDPPSSRDNELLGPWETDGLVEQNPVPELWDRLQAVEEATGVTNRSEVR